MEYNGKFVHNLGLILYITIMVIIDIFYAAFRLGTQTVVPTILGFKGLKSCIQYLASHLHKTTFTLLIIIMAQISSYLHGVGLKLYTTQPNFLELHQYMY